MQHELIFMDLSMPQMDGLDATKNIREIFDVRRDLRQPNIIGVTAHVDKSFCEKALKAGMNEVESKPFYHTSMKNIVN